MRPRATQRSGCTGALLVTAERTGAEDEGHHGKVLWRLRQPQRLQQHDRPKAHCSVEQWTKKYTQEYGDPETSISEANHISSRTWCPMSCIQVSRFACSLVVTWPKCTRMRTRWPDERRRKQMQAPSATHNTKPMRNNTKQRVRTK